MFSIHVHRSIYQNLSGEYLNRNLNKTKQEKGRMIPPIQMYKQNRYYIPLLVGKKVSKLDWESCYIIKK
jgi:hypothetical protein